MHPQDDVELGLAGRPLGVVGQDNVDQRGLRLPTTLAVGFLGLNSALAIYRSYGYGDPESIAFVGFSYANFLLLLYCLRPFERAPPSSPGRERAKMAVWAITTMLTAAFCYRVASIMPPLVAAMVWAMAAATVGGGYCALFLP